MATEIIEGEEFVEEEPQHDHNTDEPLLALAKEIKVALAQGKTTMGLKSTIKELKEGKLSKVVITQNIPEKLKKEVQHYAALSKTAIEEFSGSSTIFGMECKRPHTVLLLGIKKE